MTKFIIIITLYATFTLHTKSQIQITENVENFSQKFDDISSVDDLCIIRDSIHTFLKVYSLDSKRVIRVEKRMRWRRNADKILKDGYVFRGKACTDYVIVFLAVCNFFNIEAKFVKLFKEGPRVHSSTEVKIKNKWYKFDPSQKGTKPTMGQYTKNQENDGWYLWKKGNDAWSIGLTKYTSIQKMWPKYRKVFKKP